MTNKIKKQKCSYHEDNRDIEEYCFRVTDVRWKKPIDIYECKKCKDHLDRALDRDKRIREHNKRQEEEAWERYQNKRKKMMNKLEKSKNEDIWDFEVKKELCKGMKLNSEQRRLFKEKIPKKVLQLKRAQIRIERFINSIKEGLKSKKQIEEEKAQKEIERLKRPLIDCKKHGLLYLKDVIKGGKSRWTGEQRYKCRQCMSNLHRDYYLRKKDYVLEKQAKYRANNPEKVKAAKAKYWRKNNEIRSSFSSLYKKNEKETRKD